MNKLKNWGIVFLLVVILLPGLAEARRKNKRANGARVAPSPAVVEARRQVKEAKTALKAAKRAGKTTGQKN